MATDLPAGSKTGLGNMAGLGFSGVRCLLGVLSVIEFVQLFRLYSVGLKNAHQIVPIPGINKDVTTGCFIFMFLYCLAVVRGVSAIAPNTATWAITILVHMGEMILFLFANLDYYNAQVPWHNEGFESLVCIVVVGFTTALMALFRPTSSQAPKSASHKSK